MKIVAISVMFLALASPLQSQAKTSVWRVSNGTAELFLAGTVHLLGEKDFPLPCEFDAAYRRAERLILEADVRNAGSPEFARRYADRMMYPADEPLTSKLSRKTRNALRKLLKKSGLPEQPFVQMKPGILMATLVAHQLRQSGVSPGGVDHHYLEKATKDAIPLGFLETPDSQMELIINMGVGNEEAYVKHMIENVSALVKTFRQIVESWRAGDIPMLAKASSVQQLRDEYPDIFRSMLTNRNNNWMTQITGMLATEEVEYVLVGALHMATDVGLLAQLQSAGYEVEPVVGCQ